MCCPFPTKQYLRSAPLPITALLQITLPWILHLKITHKLHEFDFISINLHVCWPLCSHSDGWWLYAWRANRYTLYLPCGTWWMASYDDAIRQHVGFYCSFNGISVQMFIESQMLQQFENIRLCKKNSLPLVLTSSLQYQCWWEGVFRVITPICSEENCSSYLHCGDEHKRTWLRDDVIGSTRSDQCGTYTGTLTLL